MSSWSCWAAGRTSSTSRARFSPNIPVYPGHAKVAFWWHLTHEEVKAYRIHPESRFGGYGVKGMALCDHVSTHIDAIYHFNRDRPDLTVEASRWLLDQGLVHLSTDAPSTDNPADTRHPNHLVHGERGVPHTEIMANIDRIPRHAGFCVHDPAAAL